MIVGNVRLNLTTSIAQIPIKFISLIRLFLDRNNSNAEQHIFVALCHLVKYIHTTTQTNTEQ